MKHLIRIILFMVLVGTVAPIYAQDATVEAAPIAIVTAEAPGSTTVEDGGVVINVEAPADTPAPEPTSSVPTPLVIAGFLVLGAVIVALIYNQQAVLRIVAPLIPAESANSLFAAALPYIVDGLMNNVAPRIPGQIDEAVFIAAARDRGLTVVRDDVTGIYHSAPTVATSANTTVATAPTSYTSTPTQLP